MDFLEWFDVSNKNHLSALKQFLDEGEWPKGFIPKDVKLTYHWFIDLSMKMSAKYLSDKLEEVVGYKIENAFRCKGCGHVYQDSPPSSCDCNGDSAGYDPCFIVEQRMLDRVKFMESDSVIAAQEKRIKELEDELRAIAEDAAGSSL